MPLLDVLFYMTENEKIPFNEWREGLKDKQVRHIINRRIARMALGQFGDCRSVGDGVSESRIHFGPGYRLYYLLDGGQIVVLLNGGDKGSQRRDIETAKRYAANYWRRRQ